MSGHVLHSLASGLGHHKPQTHTAVITRPGIGESGTEQSARPSECHPPSSLGAHRIEEDEEDRLAKDGQNWVRFALCTRSPHMHG